MVGVMKVSGRMLVLRGVSTTDMATSQAQPQVDPGVAVLETLLTAPRARSDGPDFIYVSTNLHS